MSKRNLSVLAMLVVFLLIPANVIFGRTAIRDGKGYGGDGLSLGVPAHGIAAHRVGQLVLAVNNNGTFGDGFAAGASIDFFTGEQIPSCEYPKNSNVQYLFAGSFWIGAIVGRDTLVSVGADGWLYTREMFPDEAPWGEMVYRSIIDPSKDEYENAISEEDYIATYSDTYTDGIDADEYDGRPHIPINVEATESSYAWSYSYAEDLILFDYKIRNIGYEDIENAYMGLYVDADVCFDCENTNGFADDVCGFLHTIPAFCKSCEYEDEVNIAWIADNDGDMNKEVAAPHVTAMRIVRTPADELDVSFNWWISNGNASLDFGPREQAGKGQWPEEHRDFGTGGLGTPAGDRNKYYILRNREFDYDQVYTSNIQQTDTLWQYPNQDLAADFADGYDTRFLLSFGPFNISPGDELPLSFAYLAGENFHTLISNIDNLPDNPDIYYNNLNFDSLGANARWASWIYDNPGVDTDSDGYAGEMYICVSDSTLVDSTLIPGSDPPEYEYFYGVVSADTCFITGDGVPDFRGASPPPSPSSWSNYLGYPAMRIYPEESQITIRFNGLRSENTRDVFSDLIDFEGYRVYMARDERSSSFSVVASYDVIDYNRYVWNEDKPGGAGFELLDIPFTVDSLQVLYGGDFNPEYYNSPSNPYVHPVYSDSMFYFLPQDYNVGDITGGLIRKPEEYQDVLYPSTLIPEEADPDELTEDGFFKYFEYEIVIDKLLPTVPYWFNITAFDFFRNQWCC